MVFIYSYRENPSLGDPNSLIEELLEMRNKIRIKETDLIMVRGKVNAVVAHSFPYLVVHCSLCLSLPPPLTPSLPSSSLSLSLSASLPPPLSLSLSASYSLPPLFLSLSACHSSLTILLPFPLPTSWACSVLLVPTGMLVAVILQLWWTRCCLPLSWSLANLPNPVKSLSLEEAMNLWRVM